MLGTELRDIGKGLGSQQARAQPQGTHTHWGMDKLAGSGPGHFFSGATGSSHTAPTA